MIIVNTIMLLYVYDDQWAAAVYQDRWFILIVNSAPIYYLQGRPSFWENVVTGGAGPAAAAAAATHSGKNFFSSFFFFSSPELAN